MTTMTSTKTINEHAFTSGLSDSQVATLAHLAHEVNFKEDEIVLVAVCASRSAPDRMSFGFRF